MTETPGREALIEAMRVEQARIYGHLCPEEPSTSSYTGVDNSHGEPFGPVDAVTQAVLDGWPNSRIIDELGCAYGTVREARKRVMKRSGAA